MASQAAGAFSRRGLTALVAAVSAGAVLTAQSTAPPPSQNPPTQNPPAQNPPPQGAGQQPQQQLPTFRLRVDSVSVDVSVIDKNGKPITDLKPEDFEIRESGKPQTIESFKLIQTNDPLASAANASARQILSFADMQRETSDPANRLFVIFLDDYHTRRSNSLSLRKILGDWAERELTPRDLVAILYPMTPIAGITFSRFHDGTAEALRNFDGRKYMYTVKYAQENEYAHLPAEQQEIIRNEITTRALRSACAMLSSMREGRKTLLYVSEGMTATIPPGIGSNAPIVSPRGAAPTAAQQIAQTNRAESQQFFRQNDLLNRLKDTFQSCSRGNTAIYTLDPRGLAPSEFGVTERAVSPDIDRAMLAESTDLLRTLADQTDGRAIIGKNNPVPDLRKMIEELSVYYLLGYTSSLAPRDGKFHEIEVKVKRSDVGEVRARKGYWAYSEEEIRRSLAPPKPGPPQEVAAAIDSLAAVVEPQSRRPVALWVGATRGDDERANVTLVWEATPAQYQSPLEVVDQVSVTVTRLTGETVFQGPVPKSPTGFRPSGKVSFPAPAGPLRIRVVSINVRGQKLDSEDVSELIPDFTAAGATVTAPQIYRGRTAREIANNTDSDTALPIAARLFSRSERLLLRFDAYGPAGTTPQIALRILNKMGEPLATLPAPSNTSTYTFESEFLLTQLPPGDYILEIAATTAADRTVKLLGIRVTS